MIQPKIHVLILSLAFLGAALPASAQALPRPAADPDALPVSAFEEARVLAAQILLDRAHHSPGVIDGVMGKNTRRALLSYQRTRGLPLTGKLDRAIVERLLAEEGSDLFQTYTVTADDVRGSFGPVPPTMTGQARLSSLFFASAAEMLAEKFHMSRTLLKALNPAADLGREGTRILVVKPGEDMLSDKIALIEVDKDGHEVRAFTGGGKLAATYPTTVGSNVHPSPNDKLEVVAVAMNPTYHFDPAGRSWGPERELTIAPGPNNPVGLVWIALSRDGFGIHGTPEPRLIGKTESHGCVRLTNWDAIELGNAVSKGTEVDFR